MNGINKMSYQWPAFYQRGVFCAVICGHCWQWCVMLRVLVCVCVCLVVSCSMRTWRWSHAQHTDTLTHMLCCVFTSFCRLSDNQQPSFIVSKMAGEWIVLSLIHIKSCGMEIIVVTKGYYGNYVLKNGRVSSVLKLRI